MNSFLDPQRKWHKPNSDWVAERAGLVSLAMLSILAGTASGAVGAIFRLALERADLWREILLQWAHRLGGVGLVVVVVATAAATGLAAWLVRRYSPEAAGSGIPHVEAVLNGQKLPSPVGLVFVKFVGGIMAMGAGLALGREGPTVQMGASLSHLIGTLFRCHADDARILMAAGAGAGLATAFNAPIAGAIFVLEELVRRFNTRVTIATLGASAAAITVARTFLGQAPDFDVRQLAHPTIAMVGLSVGMGILLGLVGLAYNAAIVAARNGVARIAQVPVEIRAAVVGAMVALIAWQGAMWVGGGDQITQQVLDGSIPIAILPAVFALRFVLGAVSYSAGTPGGLFAPMLVLGAQAGCYLGEWTSRWFPSLGLDPIACAVTGMAAFFTAVVRAPLTGMVLVVELTGNNSQILSMLAACFAAMLIPTLAGNPPIYDALREPGNR